MNTAVQLGLRGAAITLVATLALAVLVTSNAPAQANSESSSGICRRTQEVRDAILAKLSDVSACGNVTDSHLAGITGDLTLSEKNISALSTGDFQGLTGLESLYLNNNNLSELPEGIFEDLESLDILWLNFNPGAPFSLSMTLEQEEDNSVVVKVAEGAPFDMPITLAATGGTLSSTTVTVAGGSLKSEPVSVAADDGGQVQVASVDVTVSVASSDMRDYSSYFGLTWEEADPLTLTLAAPQGICGRTQQIQDEILARLPAVGDCADVTSSHLSSITYMNANHTEIGSLLSGDFEGLDNLEELWLTDNNLTTLPEDVFDGLANLEELFLQRNDIGALPEDVFGDLDSLTRLHIEQNDIETLPGGIFDDLDSLQRLFMQDNGLSALPEDLFDGLSKLKELNISYNKLSTLPEDVFDGLNDLRDLKMGSNVLTSLPEDVFDGLHKLELLYIFKSDAAFTLPEDLFDGLTSLTSLNLEEHALGVLPEDIFDGLSRLRTLNLWNSGVESLPGDVFDGLGLLRTLNLSHNNIGSLPDGVFDGLSRLRSLQLNNNPGATFTFTAELERRGDWNLVVKVAEGAPFDMAVTLNFRAGALSSNKVVQVSGGDLSSVIITSPVIDDGGVTVSVVWATFLEGYDDGIQAGRGGNITLGGASDGDSSNSPATGAPIISGTAQVGQTLTADTSGISDDDGLDSVSYSYQWLADDTDIDGATSSTYTLQSSDNDKVIKVRVTFIDDADNEESLTSVGTSAVVMGGL